MSQHKAKEIKGENDVSYSRFVFDETLAAKNSNEKYEQLLAEFGIKKKALIAKLTQQMKEQLGKKSPDLDIDQYHDTMINYYDTIKKYAYQLDMFEEKIKEFSKLKNEQKNDSLIVGELLGQEFMIELLARTNFYFDNPDNLENLQEIALLAKTIPDDSHWYWREIKMAIIFVITEAIMVGVLLMTTPLLVPLSPLLLSIGFLAEMGGLMAISKVSSTFMWSEAKDIVRSKEVGELKQDLSSATPSFFTPKIEKDADVEQEKIKEDPHQSKK